MKYQAVIFDLDGVICSTDEYHYQAWKQMADSMGIYFDRTINNRLRGVSRMESLEIILERYDGPALSEERKVELATMKIDLYRESLHQLSPADLSAEVKDTLDALRAAGLKLAIGSSSKNTRFILGQLGLGDYFDALRGMSERVEVVRGGCVVARGTLSGVDVWGRVTVSREGGGELELAPEQATLRVLP